MVVVDGWMSVVVVEDGWMSVVVVEDGRRAVVVVEACPTSPWGSIGRPNQA